MAKLVKVELVEEFPLYDITVEDDHCFQLENGVIAHNSKQIISGGCLVEDTKLIMGDGSTEVIQKIKVGDQVMTLEGPKDVTHIWNPETLENGTPECYEIEFEDGHTVTCSDNHPFLTLNGWVKARDLTGDEHIVSLTV